jgi:hypothetical protein
MDSLPTVPLPSRAQGWGVAHVSGAVDVVRRVDHGSDVHESDPSLVQVVVDVVDATHWSHCARCSTRTAAGRTCNALRQAMVGCLRSLLSMAYVPT